MMKQRSNENYNQIFKKKKVKSLDISHIIKHGEMYLFADIIPWEVNDRAQAFQHVKNHLSVTTLK